MSKIRDQIIRTSYRANFGREMPYQIGNGKCLHEPL